MNRNTKLIIKNLLLIFGALAILSACKTKQVTKEVTKIEEKKSTDETVQLDNNYKQSHERIHFQLNEKLISSAFENLNFEYFGTSENDNASIDFIQTVEGLRMELKGMAKANYKSENNNTIIQDQKFDYERFDSVFEQKLNSFFNETSNYFKSEFKKNKEVEVKGMQPGMYFLFFGLGMVALLLIAFGIYFYKSIKAINTTISQRLP